MRSLPLHRTQILCHRHSFFFFFLELLFLCKRKGRWGPSVCTDLPASVSADVYKLAWQATKYMPITAGEMTGLPLSMLFPSRTSWMAQSPDAAPCSGIPPAHESSAAGTGTQLQLCWVWSVAAVAERCGRASESLHGCTKLWRNLSLHGEERRGIHHLPARSPQWKWHVRLSNSDWHLPSEAIRGLWAGDSITPLIFTDGKIEAQGSEITELRSLKEAVEELGIKPRFHESLNHIVSP